MGFVRDDIRNVAIIAHVDHGKTTLVDGMLKQSGIFRQNEKVEERVMDSNELERERGITILSKNTAIRYNGVKINIVDTPGHADFGGEVERVLKMVDGVLLLVDAFEGPMPQTRFVLSKALELNLKPIVVVNKIDRPDARPEEVIDEVLDLFIELGADDDQIDFPVVYASAREGIAKLSLKDESVDLRPLFDTILKEIPAPEGNIDDPLQLIVTTLDYDDYIGRIAIGKVVRGKIVSGESVAICKRDGAVQNVKLSNLYQYEGLKRVQVDDAKLGDIVAVSGISDIEIGETIADPEKPEAVDFVEIEEPTISMTFGVNTSPFAGREGKYVTSRHIRERLFKELETNVALRVEETETTEAFKVSGRGELHLSILIETMRREGYELQVSKPSVIIKEINGVKHEPIELVTIDIPEDYMGVVMEKMGSRKGELMDMHTLKPGTLRLKFKIPTRGLIGYRSEFLTDTKGNGIMTSIIYDYEPYKGDIPTRSRGSLVAFEAGTTTTYGLYNAQERGTLFVGPGVEVYEGMIVGENSRSEDIDVNVCKKKHVTNLRSATADEALRLSPVREMSLEEALEFIANDELVEVTPKSIRLRKKILSAQQRYKNAKYKQ
ncbi:MULTISPECIES: translational GTPase TypA [Thermoanaerobacterium]|uniref:Large ribosomal subunit assembly factor BipA n=2 Tax=Thermoanaerobacterium TaxID=28895 RepID=W9EGU6_9THEO|nr:MULTISPECIES: translational GTPase TypA [Thermoanaerobacterium]AFK87142.1 GTP-binding protein TypA [Thermoanaerobacterium saccharolyticum JW/SL-YS485]ETO38924.1 GTP-binding protein TypA [Thermoanaerobacterium aotearoense SCUT27]